MDIIIVSKTRLQTSTFKNKRHALSY